jgi:hypothetical protein
MFCLDGFVSRYIFAQSSKNYTPTHIHINYFAWCVFNFVSPNANKALLKDNMRYENGFQKFVSGFYLIGRIKGIPKPF